MSKTMRSTGLIVVALFAAMGLAVAVAFLPLLIALGLLSALGVVCFRDDLPGPDTRLRCSRERLAMTVGVVVVVGGYAVIGLIALLGGGAAALVAATALAGFGLRRLHSRAARRGESGADAGCPPESSSTSSSRPDTTARAMLPDDPTTLSLDGLCRAWRVSYLLLQKARGPDELEHAVELRRRYLDELARRHPAGFRRWLDDGARAASDPSRYVGGHCGAAEQDEDEDEAA